MNWDPSPPRPIRARNGSRVLIGPLSNPINGRRGSIWLHGAFEPATGLATILCSPARDGASHIQLLEQMITTFPSDRWLIIEDNLSTHKSRDVRTALIAWPEIQIQFIPKYACWLNLIEPWWKQLKALALKGRRFENVDELVDAFCSSLEYWNAHAHPYIWQRVPDVWPKHILGGFGCSKHK
jgi:transposase